MTTHGRIYSISSTPAPVVTDAELLASIDAIMAASVKREAENERLRKVLDAMLLAIDSRGVGFSRAVEEARKARRG